MALRDIFKRKKKPESKKEEVEKPAKEVKEAKKEKAEVTKIPKIKRKRPKGVGVYRIIKAPHITEKATNLAKMNQYVFKVYPKANKTEIKKAIEELYDVDVLDVKIINIPKKQRRVGKTLGWKKGYKKAIIKIEKGQKIDVMPR